MDIKIKTQILVLLVSSFLSNVWKSLFNWSHVEMLKSFTHFYIFGNKKETVLSRTFPCPGTHKQKNNAGGVLAQVNVLYQLSLVFFVHMCQKNLRFINLALKRLKMGIQSTLEEVNFDNADMAAIKNSSQDAVKSRWDDVACR